ncbi:zinc-binding dehydrogenase [Pseudarthrobacter psychrotolerans]|uniref:Zinc-binding dehydrogenase n=1 Tax=Pseudarthrobacter psychrotolerans TaxID=2697569 RepID=A0A6P1NWV2_9MICC|nr:NADP-dependent oxidoreductase [Pseudarthrobacter psychrotolerans]QHK21421.1 zinc-binding dehydrogenase [Pseudarthrobacter psychrotolerans]
MKSIKMKFDHFGSPDVVTAGEEEQSPPGPGEVQVGVRAIAVNPVDWKLVAGYLEPYFPLQLPGVPGCEASGTVTAVDPGVTGFEVGDEVIWNGIAGGYRAVANLPAAQLTRKPAGIDFEQAACMAIAGGAAYSALVQLGIGVGDTVLIHGAAGGVGSASVQIARDLGARVIGTASEQNHDYLRGLGAEPVAYGEGLVERVRSLGSITAVVDTFGGEETTAATVELLGGHGTAVTTVPGKESKAAGIVPVRLLDGRTAEAARLAADGKLRFDIQERIPLTEAARALGLSRGGHVRGKLVLIP